MLVIAAALGVIVVGGYFLFRRADVRLVLILCAAALFAVHALHPGSAGKRLDAFSQFFVEFAKGMTQASSVVPICSAMGFAYVCKLTQCDAHLVNLLVRPLRYVRPLMIPGGIGAAFLVNCAIVSQTSTVTIVGPVLIPLLLAAGVSAETAGALLLLGGSMGGEIMNPASVEITTIKTITGQDATSIIRQVMPYNLLACGTALLVFWIMAMWRAKRKPEPSTSAPALGASHESIAAAMNLGPAAVIDRINPFKALIPLVPILLLLFVKPFLIKHEYLPPTFVPTESNPLAEQVTILAAMLIGVVFAIISSPRSISRTATAFFDGAGFAYVHVIAVIAAASMFAKAIDANGLIALMTRDLASNPRWITVISIAVPWLMAMITGTAVGTAPLVINILLPIAIGKSTGVQAQYIGAHIGGLNAIGAQYGRTSSPVAPVVIMCATLSKTRPLDLARRVLIPLLAGGAMLCIAALGKWF